MNPPSSLKSEGSKAPKNNSLQRIQREGLRENFENQGFLAQINIRPKPNQSEQSEGQDADTREMLVIEIKAMEDEDRHAICRSTQENNYMMEESGIIKY